MKSPFAGLCSASRAPPAEKSGVAKNLIVSMERKFMKTAKRLLFACVVLAACTLPLLADGGGPGIPIGGKGGHLIQIAR